ncbi:MAG: T9SS type A sorting domain-containing protein [Bacteroidetes bacterium]|nr:MAG: T9SS type A sorting domain-containing protein [Bacteroidota bacterium]
MKKIALFFILITQLMPAKSQWVTIPDSNFVNFLTLNYPSCMSGNQMDTTCTGITSVLRVNCNNQGIANLDGIQYFDNLDTLKCNRNLLTTLPDLPITLKELYCDSNLISSLSSLPPALRKLSCVNNQLVSLPSFPTTIKTVWCNNNQLTSLPSLPASLNSIYCFVNQLTSLPALPANLIVIMCYSNMLTSIPSLPANLVSLICGDNPINSLPVLPQALNFLACDNNLLTSIPPLPPNLRNFTCDHNQLSSLPTLPNSLEILGCNHNQLTSLPTLPNSVFALYCNDNLLTSLPELPDSLQSFNISNNPNLTCLPQLKRIVSMTHTNTGVQCLPNYGTVTNANPSLSLFPLCDILNVNGCQTFWNISGKIYNDLDSNCISDPNEFNAQNLKVNLYESGILQQQVYTGGEGFYSFDTDTGSFTMEVDTAGIPVLVTCPLSGILNSILTAADSLDYGMDFGVQCKTGFDIGVLAGVHFSQFFPGNATMINIHAGDLSNYYGLHCASGVSGTIDVTILGPVSYLSSAPGALSPNVTGNILSYTISDFGTVNFNTDFRFLVMTNTSAQAGDQVCVDVMVNPFAGDNDTSNNSFVQCFSVVNSFDPNMKEVSPTAEISPDQEWLTYTVYFQNTGNAAAQNIYVLDTLDPNTDPSTFTLLSYSHENFTQVLGNVIRVNFPGINLPDSTNNEPNSHGYFQYKVRLISGLSIGTEISNTANIYFDFNPPIRTNTTINTISNLSSVAEIFPGIELNVQPNPVIQNLSIAFTLQKTSYVRLSIYTLPGQHVRTLLDSKKDAGDSELLFSTEGLSSGIYFLKIEVDGYSRSRRFIKL